MFADLELDEESREVTRAGEPIELTATEYRLLRYLMLNPRRVMTRAQLLDHVWNYDFGGDGRVLETYISYLRKKLDAHGPPLIRTVRGVGYALQAPRELMASLRSRVLASVLVLSAAGLILLAAVTYAEQRSFLMDRIDQQVTSAVPAISIALDHEGFYPASRQSTKQAAAPQAATGGGQNGGDGQAGQPAPRHLRRSAGNPPGR